jgi:large subunit ribosomal protein L19
VNIIAALEQEEIARLNRTIPAFAPGDTVIVNVNVVEGTRKRVQAYEGVVMCRSGSVVRRISFSTDVA